MGGNSANFTLQCGMNELTNNDHFQGKLKKKKKKKMIHLSEFIFLQSRSSEHSKHAELPPDMRITECFPGKRCRTLPNILLVLGIIQMRLQL